jgi:hypothetical protein
MKKEEFLMKYKLFVEESNAWKNKYKLINDKLVDIFNIPEKRSELKKYIQNIDPTNRVIDILDSDYQLEQITGSDMKELKQDNSKVTKTKDKIDMRKVNRQGYKYEPGKDQDIFPWNNMIIHAFCSRFAISCHDGIQNFLVRNKHTVRKIQTRLHVCFCFFQHIILKI